MPRKDRAKQRTAQEQKRGAVAVRKYAAPTPKRLAKKSPPETGKYEPLTYLDDPLDREHWPQQVKDAVHVANMFYEPGRFGRFCSVLDAYAETLRKNAPALRMASAVERQSIASSYAKVTKAMADLLAVFETPAS